ncbi:MBL fold metallo-hydrolase [Spiroplasma phoeniceum]|uniref:Hydrolase n=1 Tax=Spiroplasma phoeniceum P40 TaxID=1276259 RepID=A0A345DR55_9MOLU|nr:MBL fold metallo-hydrolase [Spiroplasma phoeniceum]AXF96696.1 hydrolase [Spiroplasma phoeniceum P40]
MAKMKNFVDATYDNQNVYLIINNQNEAIMIDASNATRRAIEYIKQKKITLKALFITHGHIDHYDGLDNVLKEYPDLKIYIQKIDLRLLSQHKVDDETGAILGPGINYPLTNIVALIGDTVVEEIGYHIEVFHIPGHTAGTQMLRIKALNLVTTGASLMPDKTSPGYTGVMCNDNYFITELRRITNLDAKWHVLPGHNKPFRMAHALAEKVITVEENE